MDKEKMRVFGAVFRYGKHEIRFGAVSDLFGHYVVVSSETVQTRLVQSVVLKGTYPTRELAEEAIYNYTLLHDQISWFSEEVNC